MNRTVKAPPAISGMRDLGSVKVHSPEEYVQLLEQEVGRLQAEKKIDKVALDTFSNVLASLVKIAVDQHGGGPLEIMIERRISDLMEGVNVTVCEAPGTRDVLVRVRERAPHPLWEGRHG